MTDRLLEEEEDEEEEEEEEERDLVPKLPRVHSNFYAPFKLKLFTRPKENSLSLQTFSLNIFILSTSRSLSVCL
ncbi:hypothetical protein F2P81_015738 [Scophthalmus maximus]|uniref:Uncharacterized protein n=1 Tax=Scophthalmus maximus TaxID=52904 RepID=A0A6A4SAB7_SCOMX|nr:hypothetical protein F2P81_015738 [Scophthalmus maximus]